MKNRFVFGLLLLMLPRLYAEKMIVAPVIVYDQNSTRISDDLQIANYLYEELSTYSFDGLLSFEPLTADDYGDIYTVLDANKVCEIKDSEFVLYGYVQRNEGWWFANLKLYGKNEKRIIKEIFSSDELEKKDRFFEVLLNNTVSGMKELTGLSAIKLEKDNAPYFRISMPISFYYWNPLDKKWSSVFTGIAGADIGVEFYPVKKVPTINRVIDFSMGINAGYSFGLGKDGLYPLNYHTANISLPVMLHINFNNENSIYFGVTPIYEIEILKIIEKYKEEELHFQNMFSLQGCLGYEYMVSSIFSLRTDVKVDFHISDDEFISVKPGIIAVFNMKGR